MPYIVSAKLNAASPLLQSRSHETPKLNRELAEAYEERTWMYKLHVDGEFSDKATVILPGVMFKRSLDEIAKYMGRQVPGKGKATYTKHFESGVQCPQEQHLLKADGSLLTVADVQPQRIFVNADGVRGSGKRVHKLFPCVIDWSTNIRFEVWDEIITPEVFEEHLKLAGRLIGVGAFRVRNGGFCGRYLVSEFQTTEVKL